MIYRSEIDGLRAVAVISVILYHAGFVHFSGGYNGVDIFFVISGYLITSIIVSDIQNDKFSLIKFYERRARRILPALFFVMLCCLPFAWLWMLPEQFKSFSQALVAVSIFSSNILFWLKQDYFAPAADENPLLHTWSLAVEEQFYIVFPILLIFLWRYGKISVFKTILILSVFSLFLAEYGWRNFPTANFYLLPTRAWELGAGALCALHIYYHNPKSNQVFASVGFLLIIYAIFFLGSYDPIPSLHTLIPVLGTALIILYSGSDTFISRLLSIKIFVGIGLISYSAYLWHQPIFAFSRIKGFDVNNYILMLFLSLLSLFLAYFSWRYIEKPFRNKNSKIFTRSNIFGLAISMSFMFTAFGTYGHFSDGMFEAYTKRFPENSETYELINLTREIRRNGVNKSECQFLTNNLQRDAALLLACHEKHGPGVMVLGDSHGIDLFNGFILNQYHPFIVGSVSGGCRPHTPSSECQYDSVLDFFSEHKQIIGNVYYTQAGFHLLERKRGLSSVSGRKIFRGDYGAVDDGSITFNQLYIESVVRYLDELDEYVNVLWLGPRVEPHIDDITILKNGCGYDFTLRDGQYELYERLGNNIILALQSSKVKYIDQIELVDFNISKDFINCDTWFWSDTDHWSIVGSKEFTKRILSKL